ncbi:MAG: helix-turn-helix transcriptional regulator [Chloroflexi bacterium]|nr:helix-turn-helix transcriptional regulator [Chloroflexota bacterium]
MSRLISSSTRWQTRRIIVEPMIQGLASVSKLAKPLAMSLLAVVQHLQVLEASGLVRSEKVGWVRTCRIEPVVLSTAEWKTHMCDAINTVTHTDDIRGRYKERTQMITERRKLHEQSDLRHYDIIRCFRCGTQPEF